MIKNKCKEELIALLWECIEEVRKDPKDFYSWVASKVYEVPYADCLEWSPDGAPNLVGKERRRVTKKLILPYLIDIHPEEDLIEWITGRYYDDDGWYEDEA